MNPKKLLVYTASLIASAGIPLTASAADEASSADSSSNPFYQPLTLGLEAGTTGAGGFVAWHFANHWGVRTGFDYLQYSQDHQSIGDLNYNTKLQLMSEPLTLDFYPWKKNSFHVSVGVLFNQNKLTGSASGDQTINLDGETFTIDRVGSLNLKIEQQAVNPYLGIGGTLFHFDHAHRWALGGELGVAYTGDPKVSLTRSGTYNPAIDAAVRREQNKAQDYANQYKWYPVIKLNVSYSF